MRAVVFQLVNGLMHVGQRGVALFLFETLVHPRRPAFGEFLERAHVEVAIVKKSFQLGHVPGQKASVLADAVAAQGDTALGYVSRQKLEQYVFGFLFRQGGGLDLVGQSAFAVRAGVPLVHFADQVVALVDHQHRAFNAPGQVGVGDDDRNFNDALPLRVQARHLAIQPDQVEVRFRQGCRFSGGVGIVHSLNCHRCPKLRVHD